jgi:hypothetical protein
MNNQLSIMDFGRQFLGEDILKQARNGEKPTLIQLNRADNLGMTRDPKWKKFLSCDDLIFMESFLKKVKEDLKRKDESFSASLPPKVQPVVRCEDLAPDSWLEKFTERYAIKKDVGRVETMAKEAKVGFNCSKCGLVLAGSQCPEDPSSYHME